MIASRRPDRLPPNAVRRHLRSIDPRLISALQRERLEALVEAMDEAFLIPLDRALDVATTPGDDGKRLSQFRQLRAALDDAAKKAGIRVSLIADSSKSVPAERVCWFEGTDTTVEELAERSRAEAERGAPLDPVEPMASPRPGTGPWRVYVSHSLTAEPDRLGLIDDLVRRLRREFSAGTHRPGEAAGSPTAGRAGRAEAVVTSSGDVHLGDAAVAARREAADRADVVVAVTSTGYLVDEGGDVDWLQDCAVPVVPVALTTIEPGRDWSPLRPELIVGVDRPYATRRTATEKDAFVREVVVAVRHRLHPDVPGGVPADDLSMDSPRDDRLARLARTTAAWGRPDREFVDGMAAPGSLDGWSRRLVARDRRAAPARDAVKAVDTLADWARSSDSSRLAALLGDLGMGKTTTAQLLTDHLLDRREAGGSTAAPLPILFDLRRITVEQYLAAPNLSGVIEALLTAGETAGRRPSADDVLAAIAAGNCLVIFDGLDEMLVHLTDRQGQEFTRTLLSATEAFWRARRQNRQTAGPGARSDTTPHGGAPTPVSRLLLSCRTHYFRTVADETGHLTGQDRGGPSAEAWLVLFMLPFDEQQIRQYLQANVPGADVDALMALLGEVHDLRGLAERPLALAMISEQLEFVEQAKLAGRPVRPVDLYAAMVERWLTRDAGKHTLRPEHKQELMEQLAARLWRAGRRSWSAKQLDQWLVDQPRRATRPAPALPRSRRTRAVAGGPAHGDLPRAPGRRLRLRAQLVAGVLSGPLPRLEPDARSTPDR